MVLSRILPVTASLHSARVWSPLQTYVSLLNTFLIMKNFNDGSKKISWVSILNAAVQALIAASYCTGSKLVRKCLIAMLNVKC